MGFGKGSTSAPRKDILESSVCDDNELHTYGQRFRNRVFKHVLTHRDVLGCPKGCTQFPYFVCSNDLCTIATCFIEMVCKMNNSQPSKLEIVNDMPSILRLLIKSYDDDSQQSCCGFFHSMEKQVFIDIRNQFKKACE